MVTDDMRAVVLDNGTGLLKAGFAGDEAPSDAVPAMVGRYKESIRVVVDPTSLEGLVMGHQARKRRGLLDITYPMVHGVVQDWDAISELYNHTFNDVLKIDPKEHAVLLTEAPRNPDTNREKMAELMIEKFGVPAMYLETQAALAMCAAGRGTGVVLDVGDGVAHAVPVYEGMTLSEGIKRLDVAGRDVTMQLSKLLKECVEDPLLRSKLEDDDGFDIVRDIKEKHCYIAPKASSESSTTETIRYELPNGDMMSIGNQLCRAPECLFDPKMVKKDVVGVHNMICQSIKACPMDFQKELYNSVVLSGGTTCIKGFPERLQAELTSVAPGHVKVKVVAQCAADGNPDMRKYLVWSGGSKLASLDSFRSRWFTKAEYEEYGAHYIHKRCVRVL